MERLKRLKQITLEDGIFFALVVFALGSCISGHLGKNSEMVAIGLCAIRMLRGGIPWERLRVAKRLALVLGIFYGTMVISAFWSGNFEMGLKFCPILKWWFEVLLIFCVLACVRREKQVTVLWGALFLSLLVTDVHMMYALSKGVNRPAGLLKAILETSTLHAMLIPGIAFFSVDKQSARRTKIICWGLLVVALVGAYIIGTRGIWLAIPLVLLVVFAYGGGGWKRTLQHIAVCVLCVLVVAMITPANIRNRIALAHLTHDSSITARMAMYEGATKMFFDYPLLGVGTSNFGKYWAEQYCPPDQPKWKKFTHPHSLFFQYLTDGGIVGFAGLSAFFCYLFWWAWQRRNTRRGIILLGATLSILLYGLSDHSLGAHESARVYWLIIGMAFAEESISLTAQQTG